MHIHFGRLHKRRLAIMSASVHRPCVSLAFAEKLAEKFYNFVNITDIKEFGSYMDRNFYIRGQRSLNSCANQDQIVSEQANAVVSEEGEYVLKILNSFDSKYREFVDAENEAMGFLRERGFPCPLLYNLTCSSSGNAQLIPLYVNCLDETCSSLKEDENKNTSTTEECIIRLISFLPGETAASLESLSHQNLFCIGQFVGRVSRTLQVYIGVECINI